MSPTAKTKKSTDAQSKQPISGRTPLKNEKEAVKFFHSIYERKVATIQNSNANVAEEMQKLSTVYALVLGNIRKIKYPQPPSRASRNRKTIPECFDIYYNQCVEIPGSHACEDELWLCISRC